LAINGTPAEIEQRRPHSGKLAAQSRGLDFHYLEAIFVFLADPDGRGLFKDALLVDVISFAFSQGAQLQILSRHGKGIGGLDVTFISMDDVLDNLVQVRIAFGVLAERFAKIVGYADPGF
jgi:hypothetical protein